VSTPDRATESMEGRIRTGERSEGEAEAGRGGRRKGGSSEFEVGLRRAGQAARGGGDRGMHRESTVFSGLRRRRKSSGKLLRLRPSRSHRLPLLVISLRPSQSALHISTASPDKYTRPLDFFPFTRSLITPLTSSTNDGARDGGTDTR
jgi:hypothetical protein